MSIPIEVTLISLGLSFLLVVLSKFFTNQKEIKRIKTETAEFKKKIKEAQKEGKTGEVKDYTNQMFKMSQKQFKYSTKSMIISMVVVLVAFSWLSGKYGVFSVNLEDGTEVSQHPTLTGSIGDSKNQIIFYDNTNFAIDLNSNSVFEQNERYSTTDEIPYDSALLKFEQPKDNKLKADIITAKTPFRIPFIGNNLTWFWLYVFITIPTT